VTFRLQGHPLFEGVPEDVLSVLASSLVSRELSPGEVLFREGDPGDALYLVARGRIAVRKDDKTLAVLEAGQVLGEMSLVESEPRSADAVALTSATVESVSHDELRAFLLGHPECGARVLLALSRELSRRLRRTSEYLTTVYETGRVVASSEGLPEMVDRVLARLRHDVAEATGASLLLHNPFTEELEVVGRSGAEGLGLDAILAVVKGRAGREPFQVVAGGVVLGVALENERREVFGFVLLERPGDIAFSPQQEVVVAAVAQQAGLGILRAQARQDEEDRRRLERGRLLR
jgi:CRP/FNR family transcriptional regulator